MIGKEVLLPLLTNWHPFVTLQVKYSIKNLETFSFSALSHATSLRPLCSQISFFFCFSGRDNIIIYACDCSNEALERANKMIEVSNVGSVAHHFHLYIYIYIYFFFLISKKQIY